MGTSNINYTNSTSNLSYTNKDFQTILPELIDAVKKLTSKWDPSISNESDPGVVLLKLNAIIADKSNYIIDKSILECFPQSVTQKSNAKQLYEQLGYEMGWYNAATTTLTVRWSGDVSDSDFTIPRFTLFSDSDDKVIYTSVDDCIVNMDGSDSTVSAIQGKPVEYAIAGQKLLTIANLNINNRLYFSDKNVAQNGIFITNVNSSNYSSWKRVSNLTSGTLGSTIYKFGVDSTNDLCYIEFPEDASNIIGEGIYLTYIKTDGYDGNVGIRTINSIYSPVTITNTSDTSSITLNDSNLMVNNYYGGLGGENPESIDDAYRNYRKVVGTFDTLVTLRDYINAIYNSKLVSNCIVSDRTTDIASSYYVVSDNNGVQEKYRYVSESDDSKPSMDAFDLKLYLLNYVADPLTDSDYNNTFTLASDKSVLRRNVISYIADEKSLQHDFAELGSDCMCFFKNIYPINATVIPYHKVTLSESLEIIQNIRHSLFDSLNARKLDFGESIDYNFIFDVITNSDARIKTLILDNIEYTTNLVYKKDNVLCELPINKWMDFNGGESIIISTPTPHTYKFSCELQDSDILSGVGTYYMSLIAQDGTSYVSFSNDGLRSYNYNVITLPAGIYRLEMHIDDINKPVQTYSVSLKEKFEDSSMGVENLGIELLKFDTYTDSRDSIGGSNRSTFSWEKSGTKTNLVCTGFNGDDADGYAVVSDVSNPEYFPVEFKYQASIVAKSILAGVTPYFIKNDTFTIKYNQNINEIAPDISMISTDTHASVDVQLPYIDRENHYYGTYTIADNENIQLYAPNLIDKASYSTYTKFEYYIKERSSLNLDSNDLTPSTVIRPNQSYTLQSDEYISFFWKEEDSDDAPYKYAKYGQGTIIKPTFQVIANSNVEETSSNVTRDFSVGVGELSYEQSVRVSEYYNNGNPQIRDVPKKVGNIIVDPNVPNCIFEKDAKTNELILKEEFKFINDSNLTEEASHINITSRIKFKYAGKDYAFKTGYTQSPSGKLLDYRDEEVFYYTAPNNTYTAVESGAITQTTVIQTIHCLTGTKSVNIKEINELSLDNTYRCYFVTNNVIRTDSSVSYRLFNEGDKNYILQDNEYFMYSKTGANDLIILGSGTKISRTDATFDFTVSAIPLTSIYANGFDALNDMWVSPKEQGVITVTEMQTVSLGNGTILRISSLGFGNRVVEFDGDILGPHINKYEGGLLVSDDDHSFNDFIIEYSTDKGLTWTELSNLQGADDDISESGAKLNPWWSGRILLNIDMGSDKSQKLVKTSHKFELTPVVGDSFTFTPASTSYISEASTSNFKDIFKVNLDPHIEDGFDSVDTVAGIDYSFGTEFENLPQTYFSYDGGAVYINIKQLVIDKGITPDITTANFKINYNCIKYCYIRSSFDISHIGGSNIDVSVIDLNNRKVYPTFYRYSLTNTSEINRNVVSITEDLVNINFTKSAISEYTIDENSLISPSFEITIPKNVEILIPLNVSNINVSDTDALHKCCETGIISDLQFGYMDSDEFKSFALMGSDSYSITSGGISYFKLSGGSSGNTFNICIRLNNFDSSKSLDSDCEFKVELLKTFNIKYVNEFVKPPLPNGDKFITDYIKTLDRDNKYIYNYEVDEDVEILNPLNSNSFLNVNHIYNNCTICQFSTYTSDIVLTNKIK